MEERELTLITPFGAVSCTDFGPSDGNFVLCVQGKSANLDVVTEWFATARSLAEKGFHVVVPNLHSNEATKPGTQRFEDVSKILLSVIEHFQATTLILCGKSWGGGQATQFAAAFPQLIARLVLVAPSVKAEEHPAKKIPGKPVQLFWARDDTVVSISNAQAFVDSIDSSLLEFVTVDVGGHRILDDYLLNIVAFCSRAE